MADQRNGSQQKYSYTTTRIPQQRVGSEALASTVKAQPKLTLLMLSLMSRRSAPGATAGSAGRRNK